MCFIIDRQEIVPGRRERHSKNLFYVLKGDLRNRDLSCGDDDIFLNVKVSGQEQLARNI